MKHGLQHGSRVRTARGNRRTWWTVQAASDRYAVMTKQAPFEPACTVQYSIIDFDENIRGATNFVGNSWDMQSRGPYIGSRALHAALHAGAVEISHRNRIRLDIVEVSSA
jgi:hypothetical protein